VMVLAPKKTIPAKAAPKAPKVAAEGGAKAKQPAEVAAAKAPAASAKSVAPRAAMPAAEAKK